MKGDFSRSTFRPHKHYRGVLMQQGRVQLDADWNENLDILLHRIETETIDVIGECGVPIHHAAFGVVTAYADLKDLSLEEKAWLAEHKWDKLDPGDFYLTGGRAYVDGILVENDRTVPFGHQPFVLPKANPITGPGVYLLYLDVWQRHITAVEDSYIREIALGGPDTATRGQVIWQAVLAQVGKEGETVTCADDLAPWPAPSTGRLSARTQPADVPKDPCTVPPGAGYKRLENQLYRVEIHAVDPKTKDATFKWSRDNGSVLVAVSEVITDHKIRTTSLGRDDVLGLREKDWVEVLDDATELAGLPGLLVKIDKIEPENVLTVSGDISAFTVLDANQKPTHLKVRRWDVDLGKPKAEIKLTEGVYIPLEDGVEVQFETGGTYRTGDYWLIPARTVPGQYGDIEWPKKGNDPRALLAFGIVHHYCKLAVITAEGKEKDLTLTIEDCRKEFPPLTELPTGGNCCCSVSVGQGGDFPDIQSALAARPVNALEWRICLAAGLYVLKDTLLVEGAKGLTISGCGRQTRVIGPAGKPVFVFDKAVNLQLDSLWIEASASEGALIFKGGNGLEVSNCVAVNSLLPAGVPPTGLAVDPASYAKGQPGPLIVIDAGFLVVIRDNRLLGLPAVLADGSEISILRNQITGGGVQIAPPATMVEIADNVIFKGTGPGIRLGGGMKDAVDLWMMKAGAADGTKPNATTPPPQNIMAGIQLATISGNLIGLMEGSGIVTELSLVEIGKLGDVELLTIRDNQIIGCARVPDIDLGKEARVGGGLALIGIFGTRIEGNFIAANGLSSPACGIFLLDGSDVDVAGNTIVENGVLKSLGAPNAYQAGIAGQFLFGNYLGVGKLQSGVLGYPALRVHDNRVICPAGQALTVAAAGSVLVDGNTFASREQLDQPTAPFDFGLKAGCVYILDLGLPVWFPDLVVLTTMLKANSGVLHLEDAQPFEDVFARFPDGRVLFQDNQVTFDSEQVAEVKSFGDLKGQLGAKVWSAAIFSALFFSLDDVSLSGNQFQATVPLYTLIGLQKYQKGEIPINDLLAYVLKFMHVGSVGTAIRATGNGLTERIFSNGISYLSTAMAMNITKDNEATHGFATAAPKRVESDNLSLT